MTDSPIYALFFASGVKVVFRVGLVLLKQMLGSVEKLRELQGMYETMERLRNIPLDNLQEDSLVQEVPEPPGQWRHCSAFSKMISCVTVAERSTCGDFTDGCRTGVLVLS